MCINNTAPSCECSWFRTLSLWCLSVVVLGSAWCIQCSGTALWRSLLLCWAVAVSDVTEVSTTHSRQHILKGFPLSLRGGGHATVWLFSWKHGHKSQVPSLFLLHIPGEVWRLVILMFLVSFFQQMDRSINVDCVNNESWPNCHCDGRWSSGELEFRKQLPGTSWHHGMWAIALDWYP